jgi:hypothetical protein
MVDRHWECVAAGSPSNVYKNTNLIFKWIENHTLGRVPNKYKE